jgi:hypothetical protein
MLDLGTNDQNQNRLALRRFPASARAAVIEGRADQADKANSLSAPQQPLSPILAVLFSGLATALLIGFSETRSWPPLGTLTQHFNTGVASDRLESCARCTLRSAQHRKPADGDQTVAEVLSACSCPLATQQLSALSPNAALAATSWWRAANQRFGVVFVPSLPLDPVLVWLVSDTLAKVPPTFTAVLLLPFFGFDDPVAEGLLRTALSGWEVQGRIRYLRAHASFSSLLRSDRVLRTLDLDAFMYFGVRTDVVVCQRDWTKSTGLGRIADTRALSVVQQKIGSSVDDANNALPSLGWYDTAALLRGEEGVWIHPNHSSPDLLWCNRGTSSS